MLAEKLADYAGRDDVIVLALPRGGVPVAYEVAKALGAPLDVFLVRKLGAPGHEELAMGAIASGDVVVMNDEVLKAMNVQADEILDAIASERQRAGPARGGLPRRPPAGGRPRPDRDPHRRRPGHRLDHAPAVKALRRQGPARIVVAVPIGASSTCAEFQRSPMNVVCAITPEPFRAVGIWYEDFTQTEDDEVSELLARAGRQEPRPPHASAPDSPGSPDPPPPTDRQEDPS